MRTEAGVTPGWQYRTVFLNGEEIHHCYLADEEEGFVEVWQTNERGIRLMNVPRLRLEGEVRLVDREE